MRDMPQLLIFDMDGTLFDTEPISYIAWKAVCAKYGYTLSEKVFYQLLGMDNRRLCQILQAHFGPEFPYEVICREKMAYQLQYYRDHTIPGKPGLTACLHFAAAHDIHCAVASSSPPEVIRYLLEKNRVRSYFQIIQSGEDVAHGKPAPDVFLAVCCQLRIAPDRALVIEDSQNGILAAAAAGIPAVWIPDLIELSESAAAKTWRKCTSLAEIPTVLMGRTDSREVSICL